MKYIRNFLIVSLLLVIFAACDKNVVFEEIADIPNEKWKADEVVNFEFEIEDADAYYTMQLHVRNTVDYAYRNLYLFADIYLPDTQYRDTVQLFLADQGGQWYGKGSRLKDARYFFAADPKFRTTTQEIKGFLPYSVSRIEGEGHHPFRFEPLIVPFKLEVEGQQAQVTECYPAKVKFPMAGKYKFTFYQAMREDELAGISSFGLQVKKYDENEVIESIKKQNKDRLKRIK